MELMTYGQAKSMVDAVSGKIKCVTCLDVVPRWNSTNGSFHNGTYTDRRDYFVFGAQDLQNADPILQPQLIRRAYRRTNRIFDSLLRPNMAQ